MTEGMEARLWTSLGRFRAGGVRSSSVVPGRARGVNPPAKAAEFQLSSGEAVKGLAQWQRGHWMGVKKHDARPYSLMLPFWLFECTVQVWYSGSVGHDVQVGTVRPSDRFLLPACALVPSHSHLLGSLVLSLCRMCCSLADV